MFGVQLLRAKRTYFLLSSVCGLLIAGFPTHPAFGSEAVFAVEQELIGEKSSATKADDEEDTASSSGEHIAWRDKQGKKWVVMLDGKPQGAEYDEVKWLIFSPDSQRLAYFGRLGKTWVAVLDGKQQKGEYREGGIFQFSPDSAHHAFTAEKTNKWLVISDGVEGPDYDSVGRPYFSPNGQRLVYAAKRRNAWVMVDNGKETLKEMTDGYRFAGFTPQEGKLVTVAYENKGLRVLVGETEGPLFDAIAVPMLFGATDESFVYAAAQRKGLRLTEERFLGQVVVDGKEGKEYEAAPIQSAGTKWLNAALGGKMAIPIIGVRPSFVSRWHGVSSPTMSPSGEHLAYSARRGDKDTVVVPDGQEGPSFEVVPCVPSFNSDGKLFYAGFQAGKVTIFADEEQLSVIAWDTDTWKDSDYCSDFLFARNGHFAFVTEQG